MADTIESLSGHSVVVEMILWENLHLPEQRRLRRLDPDFDLHEITVLTVPEGHRSGGVPEEDYKRYRKGLDSAAADVVICTYREDGKPAVLATKRRKDKEFGGYWWVQGGAVHSYRSILDFVTERAEKECGIKPQIEGLIGFYRTCADDFLASTTQPCYVATVPLQAIKEAKIDQDQTTWQLFILEDLEKIPPEEQHWYPMRVFRRALETMPPR